MISFVTATALLFTLSACGTDTQDGAVGETGLVGTSGSDGVDGADGADGTNGVDATAYSMSFTSIAVPTTDADKRVNNASKSVTINGTEKSIDFHTLLRSGDASPDANGEHFALVKDAAGNALTQADNVANSKYGGSEPWYCGQSSGLDYTSLITYGSKLFAITALECRIGGAYITELNQDAQNGELSVVSTKSVDFSDVNGTYINCAGMTTPWNSHLGSEEYEPNMRTVDETDSKTISIAKYNGYTPTATNAKYIGYHMGWIPEIKVTSDAGATNVVKHYAMGRAAHELAYVMPDKKTVYLSDDGTNGGFYMFVADVEEDLSAGNLYAAKWIQESSENGGSATINWVAMGHLSNAEVKTMLDAKTEFSDIFDYEAVDVNGSCTTAGYKPVNTSAGAECLLLKSGKEKAAASLEKRRYAAYLGATTEFAKEEGITYNSDDKKLYMAISNIYKGMEDNKYKGIAETKYDIASNNDIRLDYSKCGAVYALDVENGKRDTQGGTIDSDYVIGNMYSEVTGADATYTGDLAFNQCSVNGISYPDNVTYLDKYGILIIGEDTGYHENDMIWAYNVKTKDMKRVFTSLYGAETTSPFWHKNINGFGYMTTVVQHPFGEDNTDKKLVDSDLNSYMGYMGPFPALD
ncbi:DUF839 domain-containing protein [Sulfurimonas aquatica]|uniref:DUF839 domain-containing protein n=2 Tax=Sulfurimonas aquatica TaxID=2672570 RepID=A0A975B2N3_9BACT|nr:DUF839 domain-containing protein [Sulfurimonas aquatica]